MDAKCAVKDGEGSLNFNPGVDVGLGLTGSLYQDSSPTITFHEHAREGKRHKQSIDVSLKMEPEAHITKETHFKIKDKDAKEDESEREEPLEFHEVTWYSNTLRMMPHASAHKCRSTLFVFPKEHAPKTYTATVDVVVGKEEADLPNGPEHALVNGEDYRES